MAAATTSTQAVATTSSSSSSDTSTTSHTTLVSTRVVTISGAPVTQTVTSTPIATAAGADTQDAVRKGVSGGTVAGAVIGAVVGVALLFLGGIFIWRKRRNDADDNDVESPSKPRSPKRMERNISVLSKTGLLAAAGAGAGDAEKNYDDPLPYINTAGHNRNSTYGQGEPGGRSPVSPAGVAGSDGLARRDSRPLFYDQRLNPAALMQHWENNGSRTSIGTMQDQRDYSRPLNVTNPDPVED